MTPSEQFPQTKLTPFGRPLCIAHYSEQPTVLKPVATHGDAQWMFVDLINDCNHTLKASLEAGRRYPILSSNRRSLLFGRGE